MGFSIRANLIKNSQLNQVSYLDYCDQKWPQWAYETNNMKSFSYYQGIEKKGTKEKET